VRKVLFYVCWGRESTGKYLGVRSDTDHERITNTRGGMRITPNWTRFS
jgi:hypothetical protein